MALYSGTNKLVAAQPKKTRQGKSQNTKLVRQHETLRRRNTEVRVGKKGA